MFTTEETRPRSVTTPGDRPDTLLGVLRTILRWKRDILLTCLVAGIGAVVISLLLPVYYQATTSFLALSPDQAKPEVMFGRTTVEPELYGNANDIDRLISIAESNELVDHLVDSFHLYAHYDIDSTNRRAPHQVRQAFFGLYEVTKTKRDAIELTLEDREPRLAANILRAARQEIDRIAQQLIKASQAQTITTYRSSIESKQAQVMRISDSLVNLRERFGIFNAVTQSEYLTMDLSGRQSQLMGERARLAAFEQGASQGIRRFRDSVAISRVRIQGLEEENRSLQEQLDRFGRGVSLMSQYGQEYDVANEALSADRERLRQYESIYAARQPALITLQEVQVPIIKSRPKRMFIVLGVVAAAFMLSVLGVLFLENTRDINWRELYRGQ